MEKGILNNALFEYHITESFEDTIHVLSRHIKPQKTICIYDSELASFAKKLIDSYENDVCFISVEGKEEKKNLITVVEIVTEIYQYTNSKDILVLGVGGGVICNLVSFVSTVLYRGVEFGLIATTPLAMFDCGISVKASLNNGQAKNIVGVYNQASFIINPFFVVNQLPWRFFLSSFSEAVIIFVLANEINSLSLLTNAKNLRTSFKDYQRVIESIIKCKLQILNVDPYENKQAKSLKYGHELALLIEEQTSFRITHGEAVAIGILINSEFCNDNSFKARISQELLYEIMRVILFESMDFLECELKNIKSLRINSLMIPTKRGQQMIKLEGNVDDLIHKCIANLRK